MLFALYTIWEGSAACKILLQGVGVICPPGKHYSENFQKSPNREVRTFLKRSDLGPTESKKCSSPARTLASLERPWLSLVAPLSVLGIPRGRFLANP
jgi:hypothetical protein